MANPFVHIELHTDDTDEAKGFYSGLFGWQLEDVPMGDSTYTMVQVGEGTGGGIMQKPVADAPSQWLSYIQVDDVSQSTAKVKKLGGDVVQGKTDVPGMGAFSVVSDPSGAVFGLWQAASK